MAPYPLTSLLLFYGVFLFCCGVISVIFIGMKAKTALVSGTVSASMAILIAYLVSVHTPGSKWAGVALALGLLIVFAWRSTKTLFVIFQLIPSSHTDLKGKGIAFLIISLMAIVSMFTLILQVIYF
ncbi:MAG TPA: hypothetical protein VK666_16355 [Chryseolinea sp.]|nr:hypothetical protein [Chryseolinea sp.]